MTDTLREHLKKAGKVRSEKKRLAVIRNLEKARELKQLYARARKLTAAQKDQPE